MKYSEEDIKLALVAITQNNESVSEASKKYNIPVEILENSLLDFKQRHITNETILHNGELLTIFCTWFLCWIKIKTT